MIIAEVGKNHHGSEDYADEYLKKSFEAGVDAILYHIREKEFYQKSGNEGKRLPDSFYNYAIKFSKKKKKKFGITIADVDKIDFLEEIGVDFYKVLSQDIKNKNLIKKIVKTKKRVYISTGLSNFSEISKVLDFVKPDLKNIALIHTTLRPDVEYANLNAITKLVRRFHLPVAYGNHCKNPLVLFTAISYQPSDIFFYVKGSRFKNHQDDLHAINLKNLPWYVKNLNELKYSLGSGKKLKLTAPP